MSESDGKRGPARPRQVTVAGVMAAAACLLLVFTLFDAMAQVRSAEMRDTVDAFLRKPPGNGLGLDAATVVALLRGMVLFSGALAAAGAILAIFALQRHRGARIGLSVAAVLLLFSATFVAGFLPVVIAVATTMMWRQEARDWFDGREPQPRPARAASPSAGPTPPGMAAWQPPSGAGAGASDDRPAPATYPLGTWPAQGQQPGGYPPPSPGQPSRRPTSVTVAVWLTWVSAGIIAFVFLLVLLTLLVQRDQLLAELHKNTQFVDLGLTNQQILGIFWVLSAVSIFWAFSAMALAVLAFRRVNLGRIGLAISAGLAGAVCLFAVPFGWPHAVAAFTTVLLLFRGGANEWYAGQDVPPGPPPPTQFQAPTQPPTAEGKPPVW